MRLGFDARTFAAPRPTGVENYAIHLLEALARMPEGPEILAYLDRPPVRPLPAAVSAVILRARRGWLRLALPWRMWRDGIQVAHFPSTLVPALARCRTVATVYDLAYEYYPETYEPADLRQQKTAVPPSLRRADHIIAVSENTARDVQNHYCIPAERITVVHSGIQPLPPAADRLAGFPESYLLYVGALRPRKNLARLVSAYARSGVDFPLVLTGEGPERARLLALAHSLGLAARVLLPGYVPAADLSALYAGAHAVVYVSLYEGFGYPVLEAMSVGKPVLTSNPSCFPEIAGDAALLVDPTDEEAIADGLIRITTDEELRAELAARGGRQAGRFTWEKTAGETLAVYRKVAS